MNFNKFLRNFSLQPYGDELCSPGAYFWIACIRIAVLLMAIAEGISWGYLGTFFGDGIVGIIAALFLGMMVFMVIWMLDANFVVLDTAQSFYERILESPRAAFENSGGDENKNATKKNINKFFSTSGGITIRLSFILTTLYLTAPFLAMLIFNKDITEVISQSNGKKLAEKRVQIAAPFKSKIDTLDSLREIASRSTIPESAGKGISGKTGRGGTIITIERRIKSLDSLIKTTNESRDNLLREFDSLSPETIAKKYGIELKSETIQANTEALNSIFKRPEYSKADLAIKGILSILFLGIIALKFYQPRSIKIYYNEQLHGLFNEYKRGRFDTWLDNSEMATKGNVMYPTRFEDWCLNTYKVRRDEDERMRILNKLTAEYESKKNRNKKMIEEILSEIDPLRKEKEKILSDIRIKESELIDVKSKIDTLTHERQTLTSNLSEIEGQLKNGSLGGEIGSVLKAKDLLSTKLSDVISHLNTQVKLCNDTESILKAILESSQALSKLISTKEGNIVDFEKLLDELRQEYVKNVNSSQGNK
jgi:hypothetical protein